MSHDKYNLFTNRGMLGELGKVAYKCNAYAKALYYYEQEFAFNPKGTINTLT